MWAITAVDQTVLCGCLSIDKMYFFYELWILFFEKDPREFPNWFLHHQHVVKLLHLSKIKCALMFLAQQLQWRFQLKKGVKNLFWRQFGISGLPQTWITADHLNGAILCFHFFPFLSLQLLQLFRRNLQCCFAVKLQKCFVDSKTSTNFPSK